MTKYDKNVCAVQVETHLVDDVTTTRQNWTELNRTGVFAQLFGFIIIIAVGCSLSLSLSLSLSRASCWCRCLRFCLSDEARQSALYTWAYDWSRTATELTDCRHGTALQQCRAERGTRPNWLPFSLGCGPGTGASSHPSQAKRKQQQRYLFIL